MTRITLHTTIKAPIAHVFDLSRDIDFHLQSASYTQEKAIAGTTSGLIAQDETVTWRGKHFGVFLKHTSKIIKLEKPYAFTDVMIKGHFTYFCHEHLFTQEKDTTIMTDILTYKTPYGIAGKIFDKWFLKKHLTQFLQHRNNALIVEAQKKSN